ncbi:MAG: hypothetical protein FJ291_03620 [Planctomycetes bacterium]|nr:hypothetical protein [Planctomycetota bacterium]
MRKPPRLMVAMLAGAIVAAAPVAARAAAKAPEGKEGPGKLELSGAEHRMDSFEEKVKRMRGQPFKLGALETETLKRIAALKDKYPDDPKVQELFDRAQKAVMASKGETADLPEDALAYRENQKKLTKLFFDIAEKEWAAYQQKLKDGGKLLRRAFPPPDHKEAPAEEVVGKYVLLDNFTYPANQFMDVGREFCFVGTPSRGYYYVVLSSRAWLGPYEAVKRYRRFINSDVPEGMAWTLVGKITGSDLLVPQAGEQKTLAAHWGWTVEVEAIWVPGRTFAVVQPDDERGAAFAGEATMEQTKSAMYTIKEVPKDVTPERLTEIYVTAIKEKNYPLYLECIDPDRRKTPTARDLCMYHWEWHQKRFASWYCLVKVGKAETNVRQGLDTSEDNIELKFLTPEQVAELKKRAGETVLDAELATQAFDDKGKQYGSPKPRFFKKVGDGRWHITNFAQPF